MALFSFKALLSSATLQKLLQSFSTAYALKIQRKIFAAADVHPTASVAALKLKIAHPAGAKQPADAKQKNLGT